MGNHCLSNEVERLRSQAIALAGRTSDLVQRASVYHHLYAHSGGNHSFPLLAAHGALWASGYFLGGMRFGKAIASARALIGDDPAELMRRLTYFAEAFRDINRRVCVETYFIYHLTADPRFRDHAARLVPSSLLVEMDRCHAARRLGRTLADTERRDLFTSFFLWEQANIVGPSIDRAFAAFDWPLIRALALRPRIRFSYFSGQPLLFRDFSDTEERIERGLQAFDRASLHGWREVEGALCSYGLMPAMFRDDPATLFAKIMRAVPERARAAACT